MYSYLYYPKQRRRLRGEQLARVRPQRRMKYGRTEATEAALAAAQLAYAASVAADSAATPGDPDSSCDSSAGVGGGMGLCWFSS